MRILPGVAACVLLLGGTGCVVVPLRNKVTGGHKHTREALAFLKLPGTTRDEVIASLGPPLHESQETRTLLYSWEETPRYLVEPHVLLWDTEFPDRIVDTYPDQIGLFIAYNECGVVVRHEVRWTCAPTLQQACAQWRRQRSNSP